MSLKKPLNVFERISFFIILNFWEFIVFCFVGGTSALIDLLSFNLFFYFKFSFLLSRIFATGIAIIYNFSMNRNITFKAKDRSVRKQLPRYIIVYALAITVGLTTSLISFKILGEGTFNANFASVIGILFSIPVSFLGSLLWAFKKDKK
tara:strand:- start:8462 stop:8908 length:447 start_codon:yes stop_codon:yes gene_type:complete